MNSDFKYMLELFSDFSRGKERDCYGDFNFDNVINFSKQQGIYEIVFCSIKKMSDKNLIKIDESKLNINNNIVLLSISSNLSKQKLIYKCLAQVASKHINYCILKGTSIAELYNTPYVRVSGDTDIYISKYDIDEISRIFRMFGFRVDKIQKHHKDFKAYHDVGGIIEFHTSLFGEMSNNIVFANCNYSFSEKYEELKNSENRIIKTLGINDNLIYLTFHLIKHFVFQGNGIRQIMDLLLYMVKYKMDIDWKEYFNILTQLKYDVFIKTVIGIGIEYLQFAKSELPNVDYDKKLLESVLDDIQNGGIFGYCDKKRNNFIYMFNERRYNGNYSSYKKLHKFDRLCERIFPSVNHLSDMFPYAKNNKYLLPVAWCHRILLFFIELLKKKQSVANYLNNDISAEQVNTVNDRLNLIEKLKMF